MDLWRDLSTEPKYRPLKCVDMHTAGEPTRIIIRGYPLLQSENRSTLLEQRAEAQRNFDHYRRFYSLEPRGHHDMYGAILRPNTEYTRTGEAHMGVLFTTNEGYSTMCGHATIALGRFLYDTRDKDTFPQREKIQVVRDPSGGGGKTAIIKLHTPCGVLDVNVPVLESEESADRSLPVSFVSVPSYATGTGIRINIRPEFRWPELGNRGHITADFAYGGAFYCIVALRELGFTEGLATVSLDGTNTATRLLKAAINSDPSLRHVFTHDDSQDLSFLYGIVLTDEGMRPPHAVQSRTDIRHHEVGLVYFANQSVDRSPTGSAVAARMALASYKGQVSVGETRMYHSFFSTSNGWVGGFSGKIVKRENRTVRVLVSGHAVYTGVQSLVWEKDDLSENDIPDGFIFGQRRLPTD